MQLVITYKEQVLTTSLLVAEKFGKEHKDVLRSINNLDCSDSFRERNFAPSSYKSLQNRALPMYTITRDGFTMLMMSFTGAKAAKFREEFIEEFNRMEAIIRQGQTPVLLPTYQKRMLREPTKNLPAGHWSVFDQAHSVMFLVETKIGSVNEYDLVDGSIGKRWCQFREGKPWAVETKLCIHSFDDKRGDREVKCYNGSELQYFSEWLKNTYKAMYLYPYLVEKFTKEKNTIMLDKEKEILPKLLKAS